MGATIPTLQLKFTEARPRLSELLDRVFRRETRIVIKKGTIPVAAIVSIDDLERLDRLDQEREEALGLFDGIRDAFADQSPAQIEREVAKALADVRAEERARREATVRR